jgi:hypothetical protein
MQKQKADGEPAGGMNRETGGPSLTFHLENDELFKYCDVRGIDILESRRLKVTPPNEFNDPFEFMPKVEFAVSRSRVRNDMTSKRMLRKLWKELKLDIDFAAFERTFLERFEKVGSRHVRSLLNSLQVAADEARDDLVNYLSTEFALICFSEIPDNFLMWSHYTDGHKGIVVGFNARAKFFRQGGNLMPVVYRSERVAAAFTSEGLEFVESTDSLMRTKSLDWSYEKEWRQMFSISECQRVHLDGGKVFYFQSLPPRAISSVTLGARCTATLQQAVRDVLSLKAMKHVKLLRAVLDDRQFRLRVVDA